MSLAPDQFNASTTAKTTSNPTVAAEKRLFVELGQAMRDASICGLGQTASSAVASAIEKLGVFPEAP